MNIDRSVAAFKAAQTRRANKAAEEARRLSCRHSHTVQGKLFDIRGKLPPEFLPRRDSFLGHHWLVCQECGYAREKWVLGGPLDTGRPKEGL